MNGAGSLRVEVTGTGERTALAGIMRLVEQAQTSRSRAQALADRAAFFLTIVAIVAGGVTLVVWLIARGDRRVRRRARGDGARHRLSARAGPRGAAGRRDLHHARRAERAAGARPARARGGAEPDAVVFDKTGTLTLGEHRVVDIATDGEAHGRRGAAPRRGGRARLGALRSRRRSSRAPRSGS